MLIVAALFSFSTAVSSYPTSLHKHLEAAAPGWLNQYQSVVRATLRDTAVGVVEMGIRGDGSVDRLGLAHSSGHNPVDDLMRMFVLAAEPMPPPPEVELTDGRRAVCLARIVLNRRALETAVACFPSGSAVPPVVGLTQQQGSAKDAGARLFAGWITESSGDTPNATSLYREAVQSASQWDYAARALGLVLIKAKKYEEAMPYLQVYLENHEAPTDVATYSRELARFARYQKTHDEPVKRLSKQDLATGLREGFDQLEPCLVNARRERLLAVASDTLIMSFKIRRDGSVYGARLEGPDTLVMTGHAECLEAVVERWRFRPFTQGDDLVVNRVPIKVEGSSPSAPASDTVVAKANAPLPPMQASMSSCQRTQQEIFGHINNAMTRLNGCVQEERKRMPRATMPATLPIRLVAEGGGLIRDIEVQHRHYRSGPFAACVNQALEGTLPPVGGADCPAQFELNLRGF